MKKKIRYLIVEMHSLNNRHINESRNIKNARKLVSMYKRSDKDAGEDFWKYGIVKETTIREEVK